MAYTPELSNRHSCTLRRIAWALGLPMIVTMGLVFDQVAEAIDSEEICRSCKDSSRCSRCAFDRQG